jgi:hypothetical protein
VNVLRLQNYGGDDRLALVLPSSFTEVKAWRPRLGDAAFVTREGFVLPQRYQGSAIISPLGRRRCRDRLTG